MKNNCIKNSADLGAFIRKKRKELNMTQAELADICNVGTRFISNLENGKPTLEFDKVIHVASGLGIELIASER